MLLDKSPADVAHWEIGAEDLGSGACDEAAESSEVAGLLVLSDTLAESGYRVEWLVGSSDWNSLKDYTFRSG
jgi:hypothetical protein